MTMDMAQPAAAAAAAAAGRGYRYKHGDRPLDGYTIQRAAGRGGFGEVYYAVSDSGREVALKIVHSFEQVELRGIGQCMNLKSPHLVTIFDVREGTDGQPIVIMEYVSGPSLRELLDQSPSGLGPQKAAFFLREIGKGLTYLHDCGIVHRDLKPANIFYENGYVKIGDYGLSKAISSSHRSGQTVTVGTVHYMAPEVGAGRYDRSIDIYALGALLYEMVTGQPPFYGASAAEVLMKHLGTQVDVTGVPEPFASVVKKALAKDPSQRYETVQQMVEAVFGADHVRESVSCFSPESLTLVAGKVADRAGIRGGTNAAAIGSRPMSSRAYDLAAKECDLNGPPCPQNIANRIGKGVSCMAKRLGGIGDGIAAMIGAKPRPGADPAADAMRATMTSDPMPKRHRHVLMIVAMVTVSIAASIIDVNSYVPPPAVAFLTLLCIAGATLGVTVAAARLLPALQAESGMLRHLAVGGVASLLALIVSIPGFGVAHHLPRMGETFGAICIGLFLIDWQKRTRPDRQERVSLGDLITCGMVGVVLSIMLDAPPQVLIGVLAGVCLTAQIASPWIPARAAESIAAESASAAPPPPPAPPAPVGVNAPPAESWQGDPKENNMAVTRFNLGPLKFFASAPVPQKPPRQPREDGGSFFGTLIRLPFVLLACALLAFALLLALGVALDLPGWLASGRVNPQVPHDLQEGFGTARWPNVMRTIGGVGLFVAAVLASIIFMLVRRRKGGVHMLRIVAGVGLILVSPFLLAGHHLTWEPTQFWPVGDKGVVLLSPDGRTAQLRGHDDWGLLVDDLFNHITAKNAMIAAMANVGGLLLLLWPARSRRRGEQQQQQQQQPVLPPAPAAPAAPEVMK
jgi:Protein kinase domain